MVSGFSLNLFCDEESHIFSERTDLKLDLIPSSEKKKENRYPLKRKVESARTDPMDVP